MLTVEELVIESLYHRLTLVNVRKQGGGPTSPASTPTAGTSTSVDDEIDEGVPGPSGDPGAAGSTDGQSTAGAGTGPSRGGLGFLVVNAMHPYVKRAYGLTPTFHLNKRLLPPPSNLGAAGDANGSQTPDEGSPTTSEAEQILHEQGIDVTEENQTILNTGEIQLMKTTLRSPELQVELPSTWTFGASLSHDLSPRTPEEIESLGPPAIMPRGISLDNCNQFSVVKLQDKRDPSGRSVMLVQTNDENHRPDRLEAPSRRQALKGAKLRKAKSMDDANEKERHTYVTPTPLPAITGSNMAVFVQEDNMDDEEVVEQKVVPAAAVPTARDNEIDSGIWDMIRGMESKCSTRESTRESTPVVVTSPRREEENTREHPRKFVQHDDNESEDEEKDGEHVYKMEGTYKLFNVAQSLECKVTPVAMLENSDNQAINDNQPNCNHASIPGASSHSSQRDQQLLPAVDPMPLITKPAAEITFCIEASETESESTMSSITDIRCDIDRSLPSSPLKALSSNSSPAKNTPALVEIEEEEPSDDEESVYHTPPSISDFDLKSKDIPAASVASPLPTALITDRHYHQRTSTPSSPRRKPSTEYYRPRSPRGYASPPVNRHTTQTTFPPTSLPASSSPSPTFSEVESNNNHRRPNNLLNDDSGISVALRPGSARIVTYRDPMASPDSEINMSDSFMSSDGDESSVYELDLSYEMPDYPRHPDWMGQLPPELHNRPINQIAIPGSHISLSIDRDMRMDMDFSKCNYEMAEFLRKLPNLAIFNNFRGLMKRIWKAWMPKQALSIPQQLEAGVRYLDLRITKLRGALYGEHGLYTKQLKRYLKDVKDFVAAHPREIIILHFQTLEQLEKADKRHLVTMLFQTFGAKLARSGVPGSTTLEFLWKNKKQVIVVLPDEDMALLRNHIFYGLVWPDFELVSPFPKKQHIAELNEYLNSDETHNNISSTISDKKLYVLKAVLSPDMSMVFGDYKYKCMRELCEQETEAVLLDLVRRQANSTDPDQRKLNIIAIDFVGTGTAVSEILQLNFPKRETVV